MLRGLDGSGQSELPAPHGARQKIEVEIGANANGGRHFDGTGAARRIKVSHVATLVPGQLPEFRLAGQAPYLRFIGMGDPAPRQTLSELISSFSPSITWKNEPSVYSR